MIILKKDDKKRYINFVDRDDARIIDKTMAENLDIAKSVNFNQQLDKIYTEIDDTKVWNNESKLKITLSSGIILRNDVLSNKIRFEI